MRRTGIRWVRKTEHRTSLWQKKPAQKRANKKYGAILRAKGSQVPSREVRRGGIGKGALYLRVVMKFLSSSVTSFQHGVLAAMASRYSRTLAGVR